MGAFVSSAPYRSGQGPATKLRPTDDPDPEIDAGEGTRNGTPPFGIAIPRTLPDVAREGSGSEVGDIFERVRALSGTARAASVGLT